MIRLVVNADDLGLDARIDQGILEAHRGGLVTSATLLATGAFAAQAVQQARAQGLALGVHLCLTTHLTPAAPRAKVRWLAPGGRFRKSWAELLGAVGAGLVPAEEVELEFRAQLERARGQGAEVDHLDAHQHLHLLPRIAEVVFRLARQEGLPVRWPFERPKWSWLGRPAAAVKSAGLAALSRRAGNGEGVLKVPAIGIFEAGALDEERLLELLESLGPGDHELGCHPGRDPGRVAEDPSWHYGWETELAALCGERARALIERRGIVLTTYGALTQKTKAQL